MPRARVGRRGSAAAVRRRRVAAASLATAGVAAASSGLDSPENGVVQMGRGSAWVARADDPLAAYYNPAAIAFQATSVHLGAPLMFLSRCFTRLDANGQPVSPGPVGSPAPGSAPAGRPRRRARTASRRTRSSPSRWRVTNSLAIGVAIVAPHAVGANNWPETLSLHEPVRRARRRSRRRTATCSCRRSGIVIEPTISVAYAPSRRPLVRRGLRLGHRHRRLRELRRGRRRAQGAMPTDDFADAHRHARRAQVKDLFVPGLRARRAVDAVVEVDIGAAYKYLTPVDAHGDLTLQPPTSRRRRAEPRLRGQGPELHHHERAGRGPRHVRHPDGGEASARASTCRARAPRSPSRQEARRSAVSDSMSEDLFDVEVDLTWAHNSAVDFFRCASRSGANAIPSRPAWSRRTATSPPLEGRDRRPPRRRLRRAAEPPRRARRRVVRDRARTPRTCSSTSTSRRSSGCALGATVRLGPVDVSVAYQHTFFGTLDDGGNGEVHALSGDASSGSRSRQAVNDGSLAEAAERAPGAPRRERRGARLRVPSRDTGGCSSREHDDLARRRTFEVTMTPSTFEHGEGATLWRATIAGAAAISRRQRARC